MRFFQRHLKTVLSICLALLVAFLSIIRLPQVALSYIQSSAYSILYAQNWGTDNLQAQNTSEFQSISSKTTFPDVKGHWAQPYIEELAARNIVVGYEDGKYRPNSPITRAEFAVIVGKAFTPAPIRSAINFVDIPKGYWAYQHIQAAYQGGFLEGYPGRKFRPQPGVLRVEVLVSLATGLKLNPQDNSVLSFFEDASQIPGYATNAVAAATEQQIVVNNPNNLKRLNPKHSATRAEVAALVYQALVNAGKVAALPNPPGVVIVSSATTSPGISTAPGASTTSPGISTPPGASTTSPGISTPPGASTTSPGTSTPPGASTTSPGTSTPPGASTTSPGISNPPGVVGTHGTTGGAPNNGITVKITNADKVDGTPFTVGDLITLNAMADNKNQALSNIVWTNKEGQVLGNGASLNYRPTQGKNETIKATVKAADGQANWDMVSFTVSSEKGLVAPKVKVIDNQNNVAGVDLSRGFICLKDDSSMQTKIVGGDKLVSWFGPKLSENAPTRVVDQVERVLPPLQLGKQVSSGLVLGSNDQPNLVCFEGKIISDPSDLFDKPVEREFTPPTPINFNKSDFISPITCKDLRGGTLGWAEVPGITAEEAQRLCSDGSENRTIGAREIQEGWNKDIEDAVANPLPFVCEIAQKGYVKSPLLVAQTVPGQPIPRSTPYEDVPSAPCRKPNTGDSDDRRFNIPLKKYRINIINNQKSKVKVGKWNGSDGEDKIVDGSKGANYKRTEREAYTIKSDAYIGFGFQPRMSGKLNFKPFKLSVEGGATGKFIGGITLDALYVLEDQQQWTLVRVDGPSAPRIAFAIGPVPVWLAAYLQIPLKLNSGLGACVRQGVLGFESGADVNFKVPGGNLDTKSFTKPVFGGQAAIEGYSTLALEPRLQLLLYDVAGPALSVGGEVEAKTAPPKTSVKISNPTQNATISQSQPIKLEASIETVALPEMQFSRTVYANFEPISASELLFPSFEIEITPGFCVNNPASKWGIGKKRYCVEPIKISFNLSGWLKGIFKLPAYNPPPRVPVPIGKIKLPALKGSCPRIVWETKTKNLVLNNGKQDNANQDNANQENISRSVTLPPGSLEAGKQEVTAKVYSPFVLTKTEPLGEATVTINVRKQ